MSLDLVHRILKSPRDSCRIVDTLNHQILGNSRHCGLFWKKTVIECVLADLYSLKCNSKLKPRREKRFIRMEQYGLGGIITFEIPHGEEEWTVRSVFGDPDDPEMLGMQIDKLLDRIDAKLSYVPLYACTSFAIGQAMNALFYSTDTEDLCPLRADNGFSVESSAFKRLFGSFSSTSSAVYTPISAKDLTKYLRRTRDAAPRFHADCLAAYNPAYLNNKVSLVRIGTGSISPGDLRRAEKDVQESAKAVDNDLDDTPSLYHSFTTDSADTDTDISIDMAPTPSSSEPSILLFGAQGPEELFRKAAFSVWVDTESDATAKAEGTVSFSGVKRRNKMASTRARPRGRGKENKMPK